MKVTFADSFGKSLKRLIWHQNPVYKFYEFFRYKLPMFFKNLWFFKKELWEFRTWDYTFNLCLLKRSLEGTCNTIEFYGWEIDEPRLKKVAKMKRVVQIIDNIEKHSYFDMAEEILGKLSKWDIEFKQLPDNSELYQLVDNESEVEKNHRRAVYDLSNKLEKEEWDELWTILKGQNHEEYKQIFDSATEEEKRKTDLWYKWFDGSGLNNWWD